jgi:hypothetical protein
MGIYKFIDIFFLIFHSVLILFNLFGWIWIRTRLANLITLLLTGLSWTILGIFYGLGYCPLTDWHFNILVKIGMEINHTSYIAYLIDRLFSIVVSRSTADLYTLLIYLMALAISVFMNRRILLCFFRK